MLNISILIIWGALGLIAAHLASKRGRDPVIWFAIGMFLGVLGILLLFVLRDYSKDRASPEIPKPALRVSVPDTFEQWYYIDAEKQMSEPLSFPILSKQWELGVIDDTTYVWNESMDDWQMIDDLPKLKIRL